MKKLTKKQYEAPSIKVTRVETEGSMCASITNDKGEKSTVKSTQQEYTEYDMSNADKSIWK